MDGDRLWRSAKNGVCALLVLMASLSMVSAAGTERLFVSWDMLVPSGDTTGPAAATQATVDHDRRSGSSQADFAGSDVWRKQVMDVAAPLLNQEVLIDGYVLPLTWDGRRVTEFLLVPWIGACIHTPAPHPNQVVHVSYPDGLRLTKPYEPVRLAGTLRHAPSAHLLFLVDGSRPVATAYGLGGAKVSGSPGKITAASSLAVPPLVRTQLWVNGLFSDSMAALGRGDVSGALVFALLLSFAYGAFHTLGPGHGKSVVVSYFIGAGGGLRRGVSLGVRIAVLHVLSAVVIVFVLDLVVRQTTGGPPSDHRAVRLASYALVTAIGTVMLWQAFAALRRRRAGPLDSGHGHGHSDCAACATASSRAKDGWIAASVGIVPCTGALIVMLFGLANNLIWPAIFMVVAISAGMAFAMSGIGVAALWGRQWVESRFDADSGRRETFELGARLAGASLVFVIGVVLFSLTLTLRPIPQLPLDEVALSKTDLVGWES